MADLKPLPKKITNEIRKILEGCKSGELLHDQNSFYNCGTARCVAGWKAVQDFAKQTGKQVRVIGYGNTAPYRLSKFLEQGCLKRVERWGAWGYAQSKWRLSQGEAMTLFKASARFKDQFALLEKLERGERIA